MRRVFFSAIVLTFVWSSVGHVGGAGLAAPCAQAGAEERRVLEVSAGGARRRRVRRERRRGIGRAFKKAGLSAGRGGARLGKHVARGRPVRGGKEFGKGMGGFGKHTGLGFARIGKRVGKVTKRAVTP